MDRRRKMSEDKDGLKPIKRVFKFGTKILEDPGSHMDPHAVMKMYATMYPSLTNGTIEGPTYEEGEEKFTLEGKPEGGTYTFNRKYGTKG